MSDRKDVLAVFAMAYASKLLLNFSTPYLILLDSWVLYHVVDAVSMGYQILPRGFSYFYYPLSYASFLPLSRILGTMATMKFLYPLAASLAAIPIYKLVSLYAKDRRLRFALSLSLLFIDDFFIRSVGSTPAGLSPVFFFSALYFLASSRPRPFILFSILTALTHSLTSIVLAVFVLAHYMASFEKDGKRDYSYAFYLLLLAGFWAVSSSLSGKNLLLLYTFLKSLPALLAVLLLHFGLKRLKVVGRLAAIDEKKLSVALFIFALLTLLLVRLYGSHTFISHYGMLSAAIMPAYVLLPAILIPRLLREKDFWLFSYILLVAWFFGSIAMHLGCAFDAFRLLPFSLVPLIIASTRKGSKAAYAASALVLFSLVFHLLAVYPSLTYTDKEYEAALWLRENASPSTVATDTRLSAIVLAIGRHSATFEGTYWLFAREDLRDFVYTFNKYRYTDYPLRYIMFSEYMLSSGADISWNAPDYAVDPAVFGRFDAVGSKVYDNGEIMIWEMEGDKTAGGNEVKVRFERDIADKFLSRLFNMESEGLDPEDVYGTRC